MGIISLSELPIKGKKVLMRVDYNVPIDKEGNITDDTRIIESLPSIKYILSQGAKLILMSHLGRPKGTKNPQFSLKPVAERLGKILQCQIRMAPDCIGSEVKALSDSLKEGEILLLENLRFYPFEEKPEENSEFAKTLASFADFYVNDAFGTAHRNHASTAEIVKYFPKKAAAGFLLEKEIKFLGEKLNNPDRPFIALIGGSKVSTKLEVIQNLLASVDTLLIGGGMAYTFYKAKGLSIGNSICEDHLIDEAKEIIKYASEHKINFYLPIDNVIVDNFDHFTEKKIVVIQEGIPQGYEGVDIGPKSIELFSRELKKGKTILWNGPLGVYEKEEFSKGTKEIAKVIASLDAITIVGGGDSVAALQAGGFGDKITHLSTGGGATLEYLKKQQLPALKALEEANL